MKVLFETNAQEAEKNSVADIKRRKANCWYWGI